MLLMHLKYESSVFCVIIFEERENSTQFERLVDDCVCYRAVMVAVQCDQRKWHFIEQTFDSTLAIRD